MSWRAPRTRRAGRRRPTGPEVEYGWIVRGARIASSDGFAVRRFREKPTAAEAEVLWQSAGLWSTFIQAGPVHVFWELATRHLPRHAEALERYAVAIGGRGEAGALDDAYRVMTTANFSREVLARANSLAVTPVAGTGWSDWGSPARVFASLAGTDHHDRLVGRIATPSRHAATKQARRQRARRASPRSAPSARSLSRASRWARGTVGAGHQTMLMPSVERYMTRKPYSVGPGDLLIQAKRLMQEHRIRHLPVIDRGELVGLISDRDLDVAEAVRGIDLAGLEVRRVMAPPIQVSGETPIDEVSTLMIECKRDCVVVLGAHGVAGVAGIFTATDALEALAEIARRATA